MGDRFSVRHGLSSFVQDNRCEKTTRTRIWQVFSKRNIITYKTHQVHYDIVEDVLSYFGLQYKCETNPFDHKENIQSLYNYITEQCEWYKVYDFIEFYISTIKEDKDLIIKEFNNVLNDEKTGYQIINNIVVPITNPVEIQSIEMSLKSSPTHVAESMNKALRLYSDKANPDYNNAIKEAITAVEALCCTIVKDAGIDQADTLGKAINKFEECGITLHEKLTSAIKDLYKYTCNEDGKRHGGTTYVESDIEDAKFMIVTCSAILNFIMAKWAKAKENNDEL